jgi:hypothetical protein
VGVVAHVVGELTFAFASFMSHFLPWLLMVFVIAFSAMFTVAGELL